MSDLRSPKLLKKTLLSLAESSNKRAGNRGAEPVGQRRVLSYANPRFLGGPPVYEDVYKLESVLRSLAGKTSPRKEKKPKAANLKKKVNFSMGAVDCGPRAGSSCRSGEY
jgi:hypothetical protein